MYRLDQITCLHIELTTRCNAVCPMCMRNYRGVDHNDGYPLTELRLSDIKKIFSEDFCQQIQGIHFNGNLGDFSLAQDALDIIDYFLKYTSAEIMISTNGSTRSPDWWSQLADPRISVVFALDGLEDTHHLYRQHTNWHKIIDNARSLIASGGNAIWKMIEFDHNRHQIEQCRDLSRDIGFQSFCLVNDGRDRGPVYSRDGRFSHWLGPDHGDPPDIDDLLQEHRTWFMQETKFDWLKDRMGNISCEAKKYKSMYTAADGSIYPCCYTGFYPSFMHHPGNEQLKDMVHENNALEHDLEHCIRWFDRIEQSWSKPSINQGRPMICVRNCGQK